MTELTIAPVHGSTSARPVGPGIASYEREHSFDFSPVGTGVLLTFESDATLLVDVRSGAVGAAGRPLAASQRAAPGIVSTTAHRRGCRSSVDEQPPWTSRQWLDR